MNLPAKKVSAVIVTYNFEAFVETAVRSALSQTYSNIEIVIADDGSADRTQDIVRALAATHTSIRLCLSDKNRGISQNVNAALQHCSGDYISILAGDDIMLPEKIAKQIAYLENHPECGLCSHDMEIFDSNTNQALYSTLDRFRMPDIAGPSVTLSANWLFSKQTKCIPSSLMYRTDFLRTSALDVRLQYWNETLFVVDCMAKTGLKWGHLHEVLGRYRVHERQVHTSAHAESISFEESMMTLAIAGARYPELGGILKNKRDFILFEHLIHGWHAPGKRKAYDRQFLMEAGVLKWLYMKCCKICLGNSWLHRILKLLLGGRFSRR